MDTVEAIRKRRAVKHFKADFIIPDEDKRLLLDLAIQSPTSYNIQHWRFVLIEDVAKRQAVRNAAHDQAQVTEASLLFVMCADTKAWNKQPERYWRDAPQEVQEILVPMINPFYEGREWIARDEAMRSIGIAAQTIMLAAKSMGYDSCPMIGFDQEQVAELINLPEDHVIGMLLVVGKAEKGAWPKPGQLPLEEILIKDEF